MDNQQYNFDIPEKSELVIMPNVHKRKGFRKMSMNSASVGSLKKLVINPVVILLLILLILYILMRLFGKPIFDLILDDILYTTPLPPE